MYKWLLNYHPDNYHPDYYWPGIYGGSSPYKWLYRDMVGVDLRKEEEEILLAAYCMYWGLDG